MIILRRLTIIAALATIISFPSKKSNAQMVLGVQMFYDNLSAYGQWVEYPEVGYVWFPNVGKDFMPYATNGHWIYTDAGWTWASEYPWGWATFHYGRWNYDHTYGWMWIPDTDWGPAWVNWRFTTGFYGWAPMATNSDYHKDPQLWTFVSVKFLDREDIAHYLADRAENVNKMKTSEVIINMDTDEVHHAIYVAGPKREYVEVYTGRSIKSTQIQDTEKPGESIDNGFYKIYHPLMPKEIAGKEKAAPAKVYSMKDVKPLSERPDEAVKPEPSHLQSDKDVESGPALPDKNAVSSPGQNSSTVGDTQTKEETKKESKKSKKKSEKEPK